MDLDHALEYSHPEARPREPGFESLKDDGPDTSISNPSSLETIIDMTSVSATRKGPPSSVSGPAESSRDHLDLPHGALIPLPPSPPGSEEPCDSREQETDIPKLLDIEVSHPAPVESLGPSTSSAPLCRTTSPEHVLEAGPPEGSEQPETSEQIRQVAVKEEETTDQMAEGAHTQHLFTVESDDIHPDLRNEDHILQADEEGPGLRTLGIPSEDTESQDTPTQDVSQAFPLNIGSVLTIFRQSHHEVRRLSAFEAETVGKIRRYGQQRRLVPALAHRYQQLVRCHREDHAAEFASLYNEIPDVKTSQGLFPAVIKHETRPIAQSISWISSVSSTSRRTILHLLHSIRYDEDFLASRLAALPAIYLDHLSRLHCGHSPDAMAPSRHIGARGNSRPASRLSNVSESFESLEDVKRDPLQVMVHGIFGSGTPSEAADALLREKTWSSVCARLINSDVLGAEKLCIAILNEFVLPNRWKLNSQLESLYMKWMHAGFFILDPTSAPVRRDEPEEVWKSRMAVDQARFVETAAEQFLDLLLANLDSAVPRPALDLIHSILASVDQGKRERAKHLFIVSWFCRVFLRSAIVCPESQGLLKNQHIRREARSKLFLGIYSRLLSVFELVVPNHGKPDDFTSVIAWDKVHRILALFTVPRQRERDLSDLALSCSPSPALSFVSLTASEMLSVLVALFPRVDKSSDPSGHSVFGKAFSMTSSATGGSRTTTLGSSTPMFGTASSTAPSTSGTSVISDTFFSESAHGVDSVSLGISDDTPGFLGPEGTSGDSHYLTAARELKAWIDARESSRLRSALRFTSTEDSNAIFYVVGSRLSIEQPTPEANNAGERDNKPPSESHVLSPPSSLSLRDVLRDTLSEMAFEETTLGQTEPATDAISKFLASRLTQDQADYDFVSAHRSHAALRALCEATTEQRLSAFEEVVRSVSRENCTLQALNGMHEDWTVQLDRLSLIIDAKLQNLAFDCKRLRDKQWFASVVCHSGEYRDALNIVKALGTMATGKSSKQGGLAGWAKRKLKASFGSEKAQAQALQLLSADKQQGGPAKLSDSQAELTANWLTVNSIENFCGGEERIHRFCYEIQKCTKKLVADTMIASPVLWSSSLYEREKTESGGLQGQKTPWSAASISPTPRQGSFPPSHPLHSHSGRVFPFSLSPPHSRQASGIRDFSSLQPISTRPSILDSSIRFSHTPPENALGLNAAWQLPPSPVSPNLAAYTSHSPQQSPSQTRFVGDLRKTVTTLLLSDLGMSLWNNGSETDRWINEERLYHESVTVKIGSPSHPNLTQLARSPPEISTTLPSISLYRSDQESIQAPEQAPPHRQARATAAAESQFSYDDAYRKLLSRFRIVIDPYRKLDILYELVKLILLAPPLPGEESSQSQGLAAKLRAQYASGLPKRSLPRTGLTKLQEVTLNCEERRLQSSTMSTPSDVQSSYEAGSTVSSAYLSKAGNDWLGDPKILSMIQALLLDRAFYPDTLFRDLQMIAAFVPSSFLDTSPQGAAFWTFGLAAMQLKSVLCAAMIDRAAQITNFHVDRGNKGREPVRQERSDANGTNGSNGLGSASVAAEHHRAKSPNRNYQSRTFSEGELKTTSLADAGRLFRIAGLEGDPSASRELGLFYLTHPEHVKRTLRPLSRPSEVARMAGGAASAEKPGLLNNSVNGLKNDALGRQAVGTRINDDEMNLDLDDAPVDSRDPGNLATAWHWMEFAADGGDQQAKDFLTNNTELRWDSQGRRI